MSTAPDIIVVGGGIIGAALAWRGARRGHRVTLFDPEAGRGATHAAAGMLAPISESYFTEPELTALNLASARLWPRLATELHHDTGDTIGYSSTGSITLAYDAGDAQQGRRLQGLHQHWGLGTREISVDAAQELEPLLASGLAAAFVTADEHHIDPRRAHAALLRAATTAGAQHRRNRIVQLTVDTEGRVTGALDSTGYTHRADLVVLAAGWQSHQLVANYPSIAALVPTRPVKGEVLRLDARDQAWFRVERQIRGIVQSRPVYIVTRDTREVVIGATSLELPDDRRVTAGGAFALLRDARAILPALDELPIIDLTARARPGTPDNLPLIGDSGVPGLWLATGHYRNGVLLTALTAQAFEHHLDGAPVPETLERAAPTRFTQAPV